MIIKMQKTEQLYLEQERTINIFCRKQKLKFQRDRCLKMDETRHKQSKKFWKLFQQKRNSPKNKISVDQFLIILKLQMIWTASKMVLIAYASSEGSGEPAHPRSLARTFPARSYKQ